MRPHACFCHESHSNFTIEQETQSILHTLQRPLSLLCSSAPDSSGDSQAETRRKMIRQMKRVGDLCLLAGSPLDARGHYQTAINTTQTRLGEQIWVGGAHEGLAAATVLHVAAQGAGGSTLLERYDQCAPLMLLCHCML